MQEKINTSSEAFYENELVSRKSFLKTAGSVALFAALGISFTGCSSDNGTENIVGPSQDTPPDGNSGFTISGNTITIDLTKDDASSLSNSGSWGLIAAAQTLVVNVGGSFRAFTSICTHAGCDRSWNFSNQQFVCTCHGSRFNTRGEVVQGPANRNLQEFSVTQSGNIVTIQK
ncbi:MAG: Rieske (2Fe-2S) protein [Bacteroidetes bacterium]|nr:Rieske (2Fe-2S) protein [Bacteroidota bacterium]MCH8524338.1 Rieske (2Fe-2S) protein [Balneolales bacterium]